MAGESGEHADICTNLAISIGSQLRNTPCRARVKDTKVHSGPAPRRPRTTKGFFSYPDLVVICGDPQYHDEHQDVALNPVVIIEVLSESTESFDRGEKFQRYQLWNPTLSDYILVSQTAPIIEHFARKPMVAVGAITSIRGWNKVFPSNPFIVRCNWRRFMTALCFRRKKMKSKTKSDCLTKKRSAIRKRLHQWIAKTI